MADFAVPGNTLRLNVISLGVFLLSIALAVFAGVRTQGAAAPIIIMLVGIVVMQSPKIAQQWERGVVLRLGRPRVSGHEPPVDGRLEIVRDKRALLRRRLPALSELRESRVRENTDHAGECASSS